MIVFSPATQDATFRLDWHGQLAGDYHEQVTVPVPASVIPSPVRFNLPYHSPKREDVYQLTVSLVDQPGLRGSSTISMVAVGKPAASSSANVAPRLLQAEILSSRISATDGLPFSLTWQTNGKTYKSLRLFVNAYDSRREYWSFPITTAETFDSPSGCPGGLVRDIDQLPLRPDIPPGQYWVEAGLVDANSGQRIPFVDPAGHYVERIEIGAFWIRPRNVVPGESLQPPDSAGPYEFGQRLVLEKWVADSAGVPNGRLHVRLRWRAEAPMPVDYTFFLHLSDASGHIVAQYDGQPTHGLYPTSAWVTDDTLVEDYEVPLPLTIQAGRYRLTAGVYDLKTLTRLSLGSEKDGNSDEADIGMVTITPPIG